jgi:hypothetical protein
VKLGESMRQAALQTLLAALLVILASPAAAQDSTKPRELRQQYTLVSAGGQIPGDLQTATTHELSESSQFRAQGAETDEDSGFASLSWQRLLAVVGLAALLAAVVELIIETSSGKRRGMAAIRRSRHAASRRRRTETVARGKSTWDKSESRSSERRGDAVTWRNKKQDEVSQRRDEPTSAAQSSSPEQITATDETPTAEPEELKYTELRDQVTRLLESAEQIHARTAEEAAQVRRRAEADAETRRQSAMKESAQTYSEAEAYARKTREDADSHAEEQRRKAEEQASRIVADAEARVTGIVAEAEEKARRIESEARLREKEVRQEAGIFEERMWTVVESIQRIASELQQALGGPRERTEEHLAEALDSERRELLADKGPGDGTRRGAS